jgi:flagellar hook protein FlgE
LGYQTGLSGIQAASEDIDTIGNNIANSDTVGFKSGEAVFADMYANAMVSATNNQIGIGVNLAEVQQQFTQGTFTQTQRALDVAINGNGFFELSDNGSTVYSRNGIFNVDPTTGDIVNSSSLPVLGYAANSSGVVDTSQQVPISVLGVSNLAPQPTANVTASFNLSSQDAAVTATPFDPTNKATYTYTSSAQVTDSLGGTHEVDIYFAKSSTSGQWNAYVASPNSSTTVGGSTYTSLGTLNFNSTGAMTGTTSFSFSLGTTNGSTTPQSITVNLGGTTQYGTEDAVTNLSTDGYSAGTLNDFTVGTDGTITGSYSNGHSQTIGQLALATFNNPNGLIDLGNNLYQQTPGSGDAQVGVPGSANHGTLLGGYQEQSNVDLTSQLVDLITAQRDYQANAQTIKTQQAVDQTLINL